MIAQDNALGARPFIMIFSPQGAGHQEAIHVHTPHYQFKNHTSPLENHLRPYRVTA
jgi:hypothetical protein